MAPGRLLYFLFANVFVRGTQAAVRIAPAINIDLCLRGLPDEQVSLIDCLPTSGGPPGYTLWDGWAWEPGESKTTHGFLCMDADPGDNASCLGGDLFMQASNTAWWDKSRSWSWSGKTLRIQYAANETCLTVRDAKSSKPYVELAECTWARGMEQNAEGPADQVWVLLPGRQPQVDVLRQLKLPLRTHGRYFVDMAGMPLKLVGVNWYGAHMEQLVNNGLDRAAAKNIAARIIHMGFNSVRLNYALNITDNSSGTFPAVPDVTLVAGDPTLEGLDTLQVFDRCVQALTEEGLLVIVNVHMSEAGWCCSLEDNNALWYNDVYNEEAWLKSVEFMAARYRDNPRVVGYDIRNEPRSDARAGRGYQTAYWGVWEPGASLFRALFNLQDWRVGAAKGAVATWKGNPEALVIVEGINYAMHLNYVLSRPLKLAQDCLFSRVAYENHDYAFFNFAVWDWFANPWSWATIFGDVAGAVNVEDREFQVHEGESGPLTEPVLDAYSQEYSRFKETRITSFLFLHTDDQAPVWTGEFGTDDRNSSFWQNILHLYREIDYNWCYWPLDAVTTLPNISRSSWLQGGRNESFGIFDHALPDYRTIVGWKLQDLISIQGVRADFPSYLPPPGLCLFDAMMNEASTQERTSLGEILLTTNWPLWLFMLGVPGALIVVAVCLSRLLCPCWQIRLGDIANYASHEPGFQPRRSAYTQEHGAVVQDCPSEEEMLIRKSSRECGPCASLGACSN